MRSEQPAPSSNHAACRSNPAPPSSGHAPIASRSSSPVGDHVLDQGDHVRDQGDHDSGQGDHGSDQGGDGNFDLSAVFGPNWTLSPLEAVTHEPPCGSAPLQNRPGERHRTSRERLRRGLGQPGRGQTPRTRAAERREACGTALGQLDSSSCRCRHRGSSPCKLMGHAHDARTACARTATS